MAKFQVNSLSHAKSPNSRRSNKQVTSQAQRSRNGATKHARVIAMLQSNGGTTIAAIVRTTGWQPHSVRGFLAGIVKKKLKLNLISERTKSSRVYRIVETQTRRAERLQAATGLPHA